MPPTTGRHVLLVEDNVDNREMLRELLQLLGHRVVEACDGVMALAAAEREPLDVAIVDIGLPDMTGYELAERIRTLPHGGSITLIALTGYSEDEDRRRGVAAGFDAYLVKPLDLDELERLLAAGNSR